MSKYEQFINQYPLSKTLRFRLIPQGETEQMLRLRKMIETDQKRAEEAVLVKKMIDRYHKAFIDKCLAELNLQGVEEYADLYLITQKSDEQFEAMDELASDMKKQISHCFTSQLEFKSLFGKEMITKILPTFVEKDEAEVVEHFSHFTTYFIDFNSIRKTLYTAEGRACEVAERVVAQNLPRYLDNCRAGTQILTSLDPEKIELLSSVFADVFQIDVCSIFEPAYFRSFINQTGIDIYNQILGGVTLKDGTKIFGLNELINIYNQQHKDCPKLPKLQPLYKMLLSDRSTLSFIPGKFENDNQLLNAIHAFLSEKNETTGLDAKECFMSTASLLQRLDDFDLEHVYISASSVADLANNLYGDWAFLQKGVNALYDAEHTDKEREKASYAEKRQKAFKARKSFSVSELQNAATAANSARKNLTDIPVYIKAKTQEALLNFEVKLNQANELISQPYEGRKGLRNNKSATAKIKDLLDSMLELQHIAKIFEGSGREEDKDELFYGDFKPMLDQCSELIPLYNKVRNYMTSKPYTTEKFKLNFNTGDFMSGWAQKMDKKAAMLAEKDGKYFLMIFDDKLPATDQALLFSEDSEAPATLLKYMFQKPDMKTTPRLFIRTKADRFSPAIEELNLPIQDVIELYDKGLFKREYSKIDPAGQLDALHKLIDYFKIGFSRHPSYQQFDIKWRDTEEYTSIDQFYRDTIRCCYQIQKAPLNWAYLLDLVKEGRAYLFQIYNKDFSEHARGRENLHTLYFRMLFDERNAAKICFQLNGGAEIFFRPASISMDDAVVHPANQPINNKNPLNPKKTSTYSYDIIKNKRYTQDQYELHIPVTLNFSYEGTEHINRKVREVLRNEKETYVIGIDRGEKNLLYICVVDSQGRIIEQKSLNQIIIEQTNGGQCVTDYHDLLKRREGERQKARQSWNAVEDIKNLKQGYLSLAVSEICHLAVKYDAVIAMEDLNAKFKNSRAAIESATYQQFEKQLISKLNFLADKRLEPEEIGGVLNAYQLAEKFESFQSMGKQNGFLFYMSPWMTSRIDPVTGFVNLLRPRYENSSKAKEFFASFDSICFDEAKNLFVFKIDLDRFLNTEVSPRRKWTLASFGQRIEQTQNREGKWCSHSVDLTEEFKALFKEYKVDMSAPDLIKQILEVNEARFYKELIRLTALMLQMQNSEIGTDEEYLISPAMDENGNFFWSRTASNDLPQNAAANGAYNIARKAQWALRQIRSANDEEFMKAPIVPKNADWLASIQ